jgi:hypothetical protein
VASLGLHVVFGQDEQCATILPDSAYAVSLPWYDNNQFLTDYLTNRGFYSGGLALRVPDLFRVCIRRQISARLTKVTYQIVV